MQRHGYKGAFELAATVDYLFGFDATAGVVHDWMYETLAEELRARQAATRTSCGTPTRGRCAASSSELQRGRRPRALGGARPGASIAALQQVYLERRGRPGGPRGETAAGSSGSVMGPRRDQPDGRGGAALVTTCPGRPQGHPRPVLALRRRSARHTDGRAPLVAVPDPARDRDAGRLPEGCRRLARGAGGGVRAGAARPRPGDVAFLVWGDPSLYDSTIRIVESIRVRGRVPIEYDVLPGHQRRTACSPRGTGSCCTRSVGRCT